MKSTLVLLIGVLSVVVKTIGHIEPGQGFNTDKQSVADSICFKPLRSTTKPQTFTYNLDNFMMPTSLAMDFGVNDKFARLKVFSRDEKDIYWNMITREDDFMMTISYFSRVSQTKEVKFLYSRDNILSDEGKAIYQEKKTFFNNLCGDRLIKSFTEGAAVIISLVLEFSKRTDKGIFSNHLQRTVGISQAIQILSEIRQTTSIDAKLTIIGYQYGGNPGQLQTVLSSSISSCYLSNSNDCQNTINRLINYINNEFPLQFKRQGQEWIGSLEQIGEFILGSSLSELGFDIPENKVIEEVQQAQKILVDTYYQLLVYRKNLISISIYIGDTAFPNTKQNILRLLETIANYLQIFQNGVKSGPASECWEDSKDSLKCIDIANEIMTSLKPIYFDSDEIKFCKHPHNKQIPPESICPDARSDQHFTGGNYMNMPPFPQPDGNCYAYAWARFGWRDIFGLHTKAEACSGPAIYPPDPDLSLRWPRIDYISTWKNISLPKSSPTLTENTPNVMTSGDQGKGPATPSNQTENIVDVMTPADQGEGQVTGEVTTIKIVILIVIIIICSLSIVLCPHLKRRIIYSRIMSKGRRSEQIHNQSQSVSEVENLNV